MRTPLAVSIVATTLFALSAGIAVAAPKHMSDEGRVITGTPSHPSATGRTHRSPTANTKGANARAFCPPGQRKKPGKGSAFNC
jgi:hypothetical protein